jgi:hypothetical protein
MTRPIAKPGHGASHHAVGCRCVRCRGFEAGNTANLRHGAQSPTAIQPRAEALRDALLERMGLHLDELSWVGQELLDAYVRTRAKCDAVDDWLESGNSLIGEEGEMAGPMRFYIAMTNTRLRALDALRGAIEAMTSAERDLAGALALLDAERYGRR